MKLIIALGNPGKEYDNTRHNIGFYFIDEYLKSKNQKLNKEKFKGQYQMFSCDDEKLIILKPQSYMNLSGEVVKKFVDYYKIKLEDILVICDDLDTPVGKFRLRKEGSSAGHNGLKNIEEKLKTKEYKRLKIGISKDEKIDAKDYVLGKVKEKDKKIYESMIKTINNVLDDYIDTDFEKLVSIYNRK